jgi:hypothetical protein
MTRHRSWPLVIHAFHVTDEVADDFDLVDIVIRDLHADELIFDRYHQFKTIEPVGPEIFGEVRFIRDTLDIDAQMLGNDSAHLVGGKAFFRSR